MGFPDSTTDKLVISGHHFSMFVKSCHESQDVIGSKKPRSDVLYAVDARFDSLGHSNSSGNSSPAVATRENCRGLLKEMDIHTSPYGNMYAIIQVVHCI